MDRIGAAAFGLARQFVHATVRDMFRDAFGSGSGSSGSGSFIRIETRYTPGAPLPIETLSEIAEKETRRIVTCSACGNEHAVYSATAFCPVCGPRPATETSSKPSGPRARDSLALEDRLPEDDRETLRAAGVFERAAVEALKSVVSLFEQFAGEQFEKRVANAAALTRGKGNVFQRLDDTAQLFADHAGLELPALAGADRWPRLRRTFAQRHVLTHSGGIVDAKFLVQVPDSLLKVGQRLVES